VASIYVTCSQSALGRGAHQLRLEQIVISINIYHQIDILLKIYERKMSNSIQAILYRPEGSYLCVWNAKVNTHNLQLETASTCFGESALDSISKDKFITGGIHPLVYDTWSYLVTNVKRSRKAIIFNLFEGKVEYSRRKEPLPENYQAVFQDLEIPILNAVKI